MIRDSNTNSSLNNNSESEPEKKHAFQVVILVSCFFYSLDVT